MKTYTFKLLKRIIFIQFKKSICSALQDIYPMNLMPSLTSTSNNKVYYSSPIQVNDLKLNKPGQTDIGICYGKTSTML